jgi:glycosyltransferase involved in cell wall biosynthesis
MTRTVVHFTDSDGFGGMQIALLTLLSRLESREWEPILMYHPAAGNQLLREGASRLGVQVHEVASMHGWRGMIQLRGFIRQLRSHRPAVFHAHLDGPLACKYGLAGAALAGIPAIVATEQLFTPVPWRRSIVVERLVSLGVDRYIAVSKELAEHLRTDLHLPRKKIQVIHNCISFQVGNQIPSPDLRTSLTGGRNLPIVFTTARLEDQKGVAYLIDAAIRLPDVVFLIAGEGSLRSALEKQIQEGGLVDRVHLLGHREDVADLLAVCDVFVLPSLNEGLPLSVLEAMALRRPVIATATGGTSEVVADRETGLLVPPADSDALADAIRSLLVEPMWADQLAAQGEMHVREGFSAEVMTRRVVDVYRELLGQSGVTDA